MYADFKLVKQNIQNVDYSYIGIYGWTRNPLIEFYVVDNWLSQYRPGDWVGNKKHGDFTIDGAKYTVYENTRYGPSIDGDTQFKQFFSIRQEARDCGTIDITAHFQQWDKLGMKLGKMHEAKVLGEAGSNGGGTSGTADFPYAKVYIGNANSNGSGSGGSGSGRQQVAATRATTSRRSYSRRTATTVRRTSTRASTKTLPLFNTCSEKIKKQGYKCCSANCVVVYIDNDGTWGVENNEWCGCGKVCTGAQGYPCCKTSTVVHFTDSDGNWSIENNDWCLIP